MREAFLCPHSGPCFTELPLFFKLKLLWQLAPGVRLSGISRA
jgi:hypothetical protein